MSFSGDIRKFTKDAGDAHDKITRAATLELFGSVIKSTPVKTGRARGNWQTAVGTPPTDELERDDKSGSQSIAEVEANTPPGAGQQTYMVNNLPYIFALEEGSSTQAPEGMIRKNIARVQRIVNAAIAKFKV
ncbi:HK97 gp10 family phage protein [Pseudomonas abyssi]|uniref:HK97 gp10 family phage protein n=1 Tax=Pseudomonas abyssi TaxID=170540 RepID=UPI003C7E075D